VHEHVWQSQTRLLRVDQQVMVALTKGNASLLCRHLASLVPLWDIQDTSLGERLQNQNSRSQLQSSGSPADAHAVVP
jgi:hypothetical protein